MRTKIVLVIMLLVLGVASTPLKAQLNFKFEAGLIDIHNTIDEPYWKVVTLKYDYVSPVVVAGPASDSGGDNCAVIVNMLSNNSFEILSAEPEDKVNKDGAHAAMTVWYMATEEGAWELPNGQHIVANVIWTNEFQYYEGGVGGSDELIALPAGFENPLIFAQRQSVRNEISFPRTPKDDSGSRFWLTTTVLDAASDSFRVALEGSECSTASDFSSNKPTFEYLGWIAMEAGVQDSFTDDDSIAVNYETLLTPAAINGWDEGGDTDIHFVGSYPSSRGIVASKHSRNYARGGWLRYKNLNADYVQFDVDMCQSNNNRKVNGALEQASIFVFSQPFKYQDKDPDMDGYDFADDNCPWLANPDQADNEPDGIGDDCDSDDDNDGALDGDDSHLFNAFLCHDNDADGCDDCVLGYVSTVDDDYDEDGQCSDLDDDDDGDDVIDSIDSAPLNETICGLDADSDSCDDCASGLNNVLQDGPDMDGDGLCDAGDEDRDGDNIANVLDSSPDDQYVCGMDGDSDGCDDCTSGILDVSLDGLDTDTDGICNLGDGDDDGDGVSDETDEEPLNPFICGIDADNDACDDCTSGVLNPAADGDDYDHDGLCNVGDSDDDGDEVDDELDQAPLDNSLCLDSDMDLCDDCTTGTFAPLMDGADQDGDGFCDRGDKDIDGDGLSNSVERYYEALAADADSDGYPAETDVDSDDDGIPDGLELTGDLDQDGKQNFLDFDSDGDLIPDGVEGYVDIDGDGVPNMLDLDADADGILDADESGVDNNASGFIGDETGELQDADGDTIHDYLDAASDADGDGLLDSDSDSIPDLAEQQESMDEQAEGVFGDVDGDGLLNELDLDSDGDSIPDQAEGTADVDKDGVPNFLDLDADGDGLWDNAEAGTDRDASGLIGDAADELADTDGDGVYDFIDPEIPLVDSDGDTILDIHEADTDFDGDGLMSWLDDDSDGDGILDSIEAGDQDVFTEPSDADSDKQPNYLDLDSDDDGLSDSFEATAGGSYDYIVDSDSDGLYDFIDRDSDNDGIGDYWESQNGTNGAMDSDGDSVFNYLDLDSDGDGIWDSVEKGTLEDEPIDSDGDGFYDFIDLDSDDDGLDDSFETSADADSDSIANYLDRDSDNDSVLDSVESDIDTDQDGTVDSYEADDDNDGIPTKTEIGDCAELGLDLDMDGDGIPCYQDTDSDGDGVLDSIEGREDPNNDGVYDYLQVLAESADEDAFTDQVSVRGAGCNGCQQSQTGPFSWCFFALVLLTWVRRRINT